VVKIEKHHQQKKSDVVLYGKMLPLYIGGGKLDSAPIKK
jgi:hypothetical protein